ncbi:putative inositol monophosphatase 2 [Diplodia seriata]|uniref:Inositol-1-monophosphatase n=1 Tax=Diplodia seriata TaxID=420778 RepID=A0A0G2EXF5_9PEZI|nr:putative inositol monophosphatase 2 [Diplodia seriata]
MSISASELLAIRDFLVIVAKEAGDIITSAKPSSSNLTTKKNTTDIVTDTDKAVENLIATRLIAKYPEYEFVGEESFDAARETITAAPTWIVDPIDGTSNFVHGLPEVCVSLALVVARRPAVGVVYNPFQRELFAAVAGAGAFHQHPALNAGEPRPLRADVPPPPPLTGLRDACVGIDFGSDRSGPNFALNLAVFAALASSDSAGGGRFAHALRATNCASESVCRVAAGQLDCWWECGAYAWDVAAAWCVLSEAGGVMVDGHPGGGGGGGGDSGWDPPIDNRRYLAVRPAREGQRELVEEFWGVVGEGRSTYGPPPPPPSS